MGKKIWAILGGGDWNDAGVDHVILPDGMDLDEERKKRSELMKKYHKGETTYPGTFVEYLMANGATIPSDDQLEEYWED